MKTKLIKIGNSFCIIIPDLLIKQYGLSNIVVIEPTPTGVLIRKKAGAGWTKQLKAAIAEGQLPDDELLDGFNDNFAEVF